MITILRPLTVTAYGIILLTAYTEIIMINTNVCSSNTLLRYILWYIFTLLSLIYYNSEGCHIGIYTITFSLILVGFVRGSYLWSYIECPNLLNSYVLLAAKLVFVGNIAIFLWVIYYAYSILNIPPSTESEREPLV